MFRRAPVRVTEMTYRFLAPVLSAQLITAPTGRPSVILNLFPVAPPRPMNYSVRSQRTTLSSSSHSWIRELYGERTADGGPPEYLQNRGRRLFSHCVLSTNRNHSSSLSDRYRQSASRGRSSSATLERERHRLSNSFWRATPSRGTSNRLFIRILTHSMGSGRSGTDSTRTLRINDFTPSTTTKYSVRIPYMARPQTDQSGVPPFRDCEDQTEHRATTCES